jgi:hypothetical protein
MKKTLKKSRTIKNNEIDGDRYEYWFDSNPEHNGAIRAIDYKKKIIYGSDPDLPIWFVKFEYINKNQIKIDFSTKKTHIYNKILYATFTNNNELLKFTINKNDKLPRFSTFKGGWQKIGCNPSILTNYLKKIIKNLNY